MAKPAQKQPAPQPGGLQSAWFGSLLTILSGLSFLLMCMMMPLVGKAGFKTDHYAANYYTFLGLLLLSMALAVLATISKLERRKIDGSPRPLVSILMVALCGLLLVALMFGWLHV